MRMLIATGGTGGHIYPVVALTDAARERYGDIEILSVGNDDRMEASEIPSHGYVFQELYASGLTGNVFNKCRALLLMMNCYQKACRITDEFKPDIAIGFRGYVNAPVMLAAHHKHVATMIHKQNSIVGVSNKIVAKHMDAIAIYYEKCSEEFGREKIRLLGNPRATNVVHAKFDRDYFLLLGLSLHKPLTLVVMGLLGSASVNAITKDVLPAVSERCQILFVTGRNNYEEMRKRIHAPRVKVVDYVKQLDIMAHVDLITCRAGATTAAEITALGTPSILVPSPYVAYNHQLYNASILVDHKAAAVLEEKDLNAEALSDTTDRIMSDDLLCASMHNASLALGKPNASEGVLNWCDGMKRWT